MQGRIMRPDTNEPRLLLPRVGFIKVGFKNEKGFPQSVDYFIPTGKYSSLFTKAYGEKPKVIQIVFSEDDPGKVCIERYEYRDKEGKLYASGNGELFEVWDGKQYQPLSIKDYPNLMKIIEKRCPNKATETGLNGWEIVLTLNFIIPMVKGIAGIWQFTTKGDQSTIPQIRGLFDEMTKERGFVRGIIFDLTVDFAKSQKPGVKSRYPVVSLIPNESDENIDKLKNVYKKGIENGQH